MWLALLLEINYSEAVIQGTKLSPALAGSPPGNIQIQLKAKIDTLTANKGIDEVSKSQLLALYQLSLDNLANIESYNTRTVKYEEAIKNAPEKTKKLQQEIQQGQLKSGKQKTEDFAQIPVEELEQRLILEKGKIDALDEQIQSAEKELALQNDRPQQIRQETLAAQNALDSAQKKLDHPESAVTNTEAEAGQIQLSTFVDARKAELKMLTAEANSNLIRVELLKAGLQILKLQKDQLSPVISSIENLVNIHRQQEAINLQNELTQAEKTASGKHALIQQAARDNIQYSRDLQAISGKIETYTELNKKVDVTASEIEADYKSAEKKISLAGLSPVLGKILREQRRNLLNRDQFVSESEASIQSEMALTSLEQFKIEDKLKLLSDMDAYLQGLMGQQVDKSLPNDKRMMIQAELRILLNNQKDLLNKLSSAYATYLRTLGDFDFAKQQMLGQANKYAEYLDERLLWVPSSAPINGSYLAGLYDSVKWFLSPHNGLGLIKDISTIAWENKLLALLVLSGLYVVPRLRRWAKLQLQVVAKTSEKIYTDSFSNTLKAFGFTLILVLPLPLIGYLLGLLLSTNIQAANFSKAVGVGLQSIMIPLSALQLFYRLFAADGIAVVHFRWQKSNAFLLQRQIAWLRFVIVPCVFIINCTGASVVTNHSDYLGRLALIIAMSAMAVFFVRLLHPATGLFQAYIKANPDDGFSKLRFLWYPLIVLAPIAVIGFAATGYYLSALELQQKLITTIRLIFGLVIVYGMAIRWLTLVNRQLAIKNARQRLKTAQNEKQNTIDGVASDAPVLPVDEQLIDIPTINAQTIKLLVVFIGFTLIVGVWMIWRNILPAFSFLDQIVLWQHLVTVDNQESYQPITLTNLMMAGLYVFIVTVSVRNFPGLMELLVFARLSITAGGRYAVNQLARYLIITIGFICIANELGGSWSQVQWLVAALSVGLGFGLQEIFANLVSGIILLFERPIRVGDTVTINSVTGKVSRIQMRATTIIDYDHKELIVPNKTFITNQLVNWTLSDTTTRIQIPLIIAFGSDVASAYNLMLEVARSTPLVLEDPMPSVVFTSIKDGGLEFTLTVFVSELGHRMHVTHDLNTRLEKMLRENHIELPMLQREIQFLDLEKGN